MRPSFPHSPLSSSGISRGETLTVAAITLILALLFIPACTRGPDTNARSGDLTQTLANMQQLQQAAARMAQDSGTLVTNNTLAWPAELGSTYTNWTTALVENKYLTAEQLAKLLSSPGRALRTDVIPFANNAPVLVYAVGKDSPPNTVLLSTDNFINTQQGGLLDPSATSHGTKDFAIVRKDGTSAILKPSDAGNTNLVGAFAPLCH